MYYTKDWEIHIPKDGRIMRNRIISYCGVFNTWSSDYTKYEINILKTRHRILQFNVRQWALNIAMYYQYTEKTRKDGIGTIYWIVYRI